MNTRHLLLLVLTLTLAGCLGVVQQPSVTRDLRVPEAPDAAYTRALQATLKVGGTLWQQDSGQRMLQAFVGTFGERLQVQVRPEGTGSLLLVETQRNASLISGHVPSHLIEEFVYAYQTR